MLDLPRKDFIERTLSMTLFVERFLLEQAFTTVGPRDERHSKWCDEKAKGIILRAREAIGAMSDLELGEGFVASGRRVSALARSIMEPFILEATDLQKQPWFQSGLGHLDHQASFHHWATMDYLNLDEAVCLTLGVPPTTFSEAQLLRFSKNEFDPGMRSLRVGKFIGGRYEAIRRKFDPQTTGAVAFQTVELTAWIHEVELEVPEKFRSSFQKRFEPLSVGKPSQKNAKVDRRELNSIAKLLTVVAIEQFDYQPSSPRSRVPAKIKDMADRLGLELSEDTIRKFLRLGADSLPK